MSEQQLDKNRLKEIALAQFVGSLNVTQKKMVKLSNRGIKRALFAALSHGVTDAQFEFKSKEEAEVAGLLAKTLDLRLNIIALNHEKENSDG